MSGSLQPSHAPGTSVPPFQWLRQLQALLNRTTRLLLVALVATMFLVLLLQIVSRFVLFFPIPWSQELLQYLNIWMVFLGASLAVAEGAHIRIDLVRTAIPRAWGRGLTLLAHGVSLLLVSVVAWQSGILMTKTMHQSIGSFPVPMGWFYLSVLLGCSLMGLNYAVRILLVLAGVSAEGDSGSAHGHAAPPCPAADGPDHSPGGAS